MKEYLFVIITGILSGFIVFGGQVFLNLGLSLFQISFITQLLIVLMLLPFIILDKNLRPKNLNWLWVLYGFATAIIVFAQYGAVILGLSVAIVVLLLYTQPLWTIIISRLFFKEKLTKTKIISCIIVLVGMIILVNPFGAEIKSSAGVILALVGGIALSLWVIIGSVVSKRKVPPVTIKFMNATLTVMFFLIFYPILLLFTREPSIIRLSFDLSLTLWFGLIIFTLFVEIINHLSYYKGVRKVPATDAGIILLLEPVTAALLATTFLNQPLTLNIIAGGILILLANYLIIKK
jgi:drug/metabolite transporter (DMT)-like permease